MELGEKISTSPRYVIDITETESALFGGVEGGVNSE